MLINANQIRLGTIIKEEGELYRVTFRQHYVREMRRAIIQVKMKSLRTGLQKERRYSSEERVETAILDQVEMEYLYNEGDFYYFMNTQNYEQTTLPKELVGEAIPYLVHNLKVQVDFFEGRAIGIILPYKVDLKVISTPPSLKRATATASNKPATLETGLVVQVPQFINEGDIIRVDTTTGDYVERTKSR